jgi:hypothetical protein
MHKVDTNICSTDSRAAITLPHVDQRCNGARFASFGPQSPGRCSTSHHKSETTEMNGNHQVRCQPSQILSQVLRVLRSIIFVLSALEISPVTASTALSHPGPSSVTGRSLDAILKLTIPMALDSCCAPFFRSVHLRSFADTARCVHPRLITSTISTRNHWCTSAPYRG